MESIFDLEVKEKKAQKELLRSKTNGRRKSGHMFPIDFMSADERKEYTRAGEITVTSIWDQILTRSQYDELSDEKKKQAMEHWRKIHSVKAIKEALGYNDYNIYKEFDRIGITVEKRAPRGSSERHQKKQERAGKAVAIAAAPKMSLLEFAEAAPDPEPPKQPDPIKPDFAAAIAAAIKEIQEAAAPQPQDQPQGALFALNEILDAATLATKLMKYASFLEDEPHKFKIRLEISEIK